jgi:hypothetical protein
MTRLIKASKETKRATTCQHVERNEFNQIRYKQKSLQIVHRDQIKNRIAQ